MPDIKAQWSAGKISVALVLPGLQRKGLCGKEAFC